MKFDYKLKKYWGKTEHSISVLMVIEEDIAKFTNDPFDINVRYGGRGDSRTFHLTEILTPEFTDEVNYICYIHDRLADLVKLNVVGYTKEFVDKIFHELLIAEEFPLADVYYFMVDLFGGDYK